MERVTTSGLYTGVLNSLTSAQSQISQDAAEASSGMTANDLKGFGGGAETLTAMQNVQSSVTTYLNNTQNTTALLSQQNVALTQLGTDATGASTALTDALGTSSGATLMQTLSDIYGDAVNQLNTQYNGHYIFAGGQVDTAPVSASSLTALAAAPSVASVFNNDQNVPTTQLDASTSIQTGFLASNLGTPLFTALQAIQTFDQGPNGPFGNPLTSSQITFLQGQIAALNTAGTGITQATGQNGLFQNQVTDVQNSLTQQQTSLQTMIGDKDNANLAQVAANLQQAQLAVQVSAQVFATLKASSLASLLPIS